MKKRFWDFGKYYFILLFVLIFSFIAIASVCGDVNESAAEVAVKNLEDDARLFTSYFDDMVSQDLSHLNQLGKRLEELAASSQQEVQEIIDDYKEIFHSIEVLNTEGNREYGDVIDIDLTQGGLLDSLVFDRENVVYGGKIKEQDGQESIVLCTPLERMGGVIGILLGTVPV